MEPALIQTLYRRALPDELVAFSSPLGRAMFREALAHGTMEGWFALAEQLHTQADPAFCGLASLVVALNALGIDPKRPWKGAWRWYSEELLDCCVPLPVVQQQGITLDELGCLARCNGLEAEVVHAGAGDAAAELAALTAALLAAGRGEGDVVIASYSRGALGQTGDGHFTPVGGVSADERSALLLDVARFKYPPHWARIERLYQAMLPEDPASRRPRGWLRLRRRHTGTGALASLLCGHAGWRDVVAAFEEVLARWPAAGAAADEATSEAAALRAFVEELPRLRRFVEWRAPSDDAHRAEVERMRRQLRDSPAGRALARHTDDVELAALILLVLGPWLPAPAAMAALVAPSSLEPPLAAEIELVRRQLESLRQVACEERAGAAADGCGATGEPCRR